MKWLYGEQGSEVDVAMRRVEVGTESAEVMARVCETWDVDRLNSDRECRRCHAALLTPLSVNHSPSPGSPVFNTGRKGDAEVPRCRGTVTKGFGGVPLRLGLRSRSYSGAGGSPALQGRGASLVNA